MFAPSDGLLTYCNVRYIGLRGHFYKFDGSIILRKLNSVTTISKSLLFVDRPKKRSQRAPKVYKL